MWDGSSLPLLREGAWLGREVTFFPEAQKARVFRGCGAVVFNCCLFWPSPFKTALKAPEGKPAGVNILLLLLLGGGRI